MSVWAYISLNELNEAKNINAAAAKNKRWVAILVSHF